MEIRRWIEFLVFDDVNGLFDYGESGPASGRKSDCKCYLTASIATLIKLQYNDTLDAYIEKVIILIVNP